MPERVVRSMRILRLLPVALAVVFRATPADAHQLNVFAHVEGNTVQGEVYSHGHTPAPDATVSIFDPEGEKLGETTTDERGKFSFDVRFRCDHWLVVDAGGGHGAQYTVAADELPDDLPPRGSKTSSPRKRADKTAKPLSTHHTHSAPPDDRALAEKLEALRKQVVGLRKDLAEYKEKVRLQDVLGGIGYILGIMGLAFYFLGVRRIKGGGQSR